MPGNGSPQRSQRARDLVCWVSGLDRLKEEHVLVAIRFRGLHVVDVEWRIAIGGWP